MPKAKLAGLIPAVGYLRRSTDKQEASIAEQRSAVQQYADQHGYVIVRWYIDDAITGDSIELRPDFCKMREDCASGEFKFILCWDHKRFGRFDSIDGGYAVRPMRAAGVTLVLLAEGPVDWDSPTGRMIFGMKSEGAKQDNVDLAHNVTRGQVEAAKQGGWIGGVPYGYELEGPKKQRKLKLGDAAECKIVERIFREFVTDGRSMSNIANRLNADGVASSGGRGKPWRFDAVKTILENPAYVGDYRGSRSCNGKYYTTRAGEVVKSTGKRCRKPESEWIVHPDHHAAIIDRETFARAQAILAKGKTGRSNKYTPDNNPYLFGGGLLRCGLCGAPMYGIDTRLMSYECKDRRFGKCKGTTVREREVLQCLADHFENFFGEDTDALDAASFYSHLKPGDKLPKAFAEIKQQLMPRRLPKQDRKRLEKQRDDVNAKRTKGRKNLLLLEPENIQAAQQLLKELDVEYAELEQELAQWKPPAEAEVNRVVETVLHQLFGFAFLCRFLAQPAELRAQRRGSLYDGAPGRVRRFLANVDKVVAHSTIRGRGHGTRHEFTCGEIHLKRVGSVMGNQNRHLPG